MFYCACCSLLNTVIVNKIRDVFNAKLEIGDLYKNQNGKLSQSNRVYGIC